MNPVEPRTVLFKHMERQWAERLVKFGEFRIGTLYKYSTDASLHSSIHDPDEGTELRVLDDAGSQVELQGERLQFAKQVLELNGIRGDIRVGGGMKFTAAAHWPNALLYCLTRNERIGGEFDPKYDTVVAIRNVPAFAASLTLAIVSKIPLLVRGTRQVKATIRDVDYRSREIGFNDKSLSEPYMIKPSNYASQREVRIIWHIPLGRMEPVDVCSVEAARYCQIVR
jgi:hypothetical protein